MRLLLRVYETRCEETDTALDQNLTSPIHEALTRLDDNPNSDN